MHLHLLWSTKSVQSRQCRCGCCDSNPRSWAPHCRQAHIMCVCVILACASQPITAQHRGAIQSNYRSWSQSELAWNLSARFHPSSNYEYIQWCQKNKTQKISNTRLSFYLSICIIVLFKNKHVRYLFYVLSILLLFLVRKARKQALLKWQT